MMPTEYRRTGAPQPVRAASRLARRLAAVIAECHYAQRRVLALRIAPDSYLSDAATAPDCYGDFLFRTSGPLLREPSARARAAGRRVAG
jgi:hypothetical protein